MMFRSFLAFRSHNIHLALLTHLLPRYEAGAVLSPGALAPFVGSETRVGRKGLIAAGLVTVSRPFQWTEPKHAFSF